MTIKELRLVLSEIDNQSMTIKDLRSILFAQEDQDQVLNNMDLFRLTYGK